MNKYIPALEKPEMARGGNFNKDEIREKTIRIRKETYDRLRKLGEFGMDFDDVVTKVLDELEGFKQGGEKRPKGKS